MSKENIYEIDWERSTNNLKKIVAELVKRLGSEHLACIFDISYQAINKWTLPLENPNHTKPSLDNIYVLAQLSDSSIEDIIVLKEEEVEMKLQKIAPCRKNNNNQDFENSKYNRTIDFNDKVCEYGIPKFEIEQEQYDEFCSTYNNPCIDTYKKAFDVLKKCKPKKSDDLYVWCFGEPDEAYTPAYIFDAMISKIRGMISMLGHYGVIYGTIQASSFEIDRVANYTTWHNVVIQLINDAIKDFQISDYEGIEDVKELRRLFYSDIKRLHRIFEIARGENLITENFKFELKE